MTEEQLKILGFEEQTETSEPTFYYYTLDIVDAKKLSNLIEILNQNKDERD